MKKIIKLFMMILSTVSYSQTAITDANFQTAINTCLSTNPVDGLCSDSEYGAMPDWDVSSVTDMSYAFDEKSNFDGDISGWDVSSVTDMQAMFLGARSFNQDISTWDVSSVIDMGYMFGVAGSFNQDISGWNVSNVTSMYKIFFGATSFNQPIGDWDVSNLVSMDGMFKNAESFNQPIGDWDVSNVTSMNNMFSSAFVFNQPLNNWDVSSVTDMASMFRYATAFNQDISSWCVTNIASEPTDFSTDSPLIEINKPVWGTCPTASVDDQNQLDISIYPNPSSDIVYIEGNYTQLKVVIYNVLGKEILNKSITNSIDISHLDNGVYILQLSDGAKLTTQRIIKN